MSASSLAALPLLLGSSVNATAQQLSPMSQSSGLAGARRAVVSIQAETTDGTFRGSGVVLTATGVIATAAHVLDGATSVRVRTPSGITLPAEGWIHVDSDLDLALLKVDASGLPAATLGTSLKLEVGSRLLSIGSPMGLDQTIADGVLSAVRQDGDRTLMQVSIPISPGSSGGPIVTPEGLVVGLVVSGIRGGGAENLNFALPISYAVAALEITGNKAPRAWSGATTRPAATAPTPRAEVAALRRPTGVPAQVNDSLDLDWRLLDRAELLVEERPNRDQLWRWDRSVKYAVVADESAVLTFERQEETSIMSGDTPWLTVWSKWGQIRNRVSFQLRPGGNLTFHYRAPVDFSDPNRLSERQITIVDSVAELSVDGRVVDRMWVPSGIIHTSMTGAAFTALRGPIPEIAYLWFLAENEGRLEVRSARIRRTGATSALNVPMAREGAPCSVRGTVRTRLEVVEVELIEGANASKSWRLADAPHLGIDSDVKCVKFARR